MSVTKAPIEADNEARTTSLGLFGSACEYFAVAVAVAVAVAANDKLGADQRRFGIALMPVNFLIGQAVELALKAYLREAGATLKDMRSLGHDLELSFREAISKGLVISWDATDQTMVSLLNQQYRPREFQYIKTGSKVFPEIEPLSKTTAKLLKAVGDQVPDAKGFFLGQRVGRAVLDVLQR